MNKDSRLSLDERLDEAFCQADAKREQANLLRRAAERNPTEMAALAREIIPHLMEQNRAHAAQICGVDVAEPDWSRSPDWRKKAASLNPLDLLMVYQIGNGYLMYKRCRGEIAELDSNATLSKEQREAKICEAVLSAFEDLAAVWLRGLAELSAWACSSNGKDSKAAKLAKDEEGRRLAGYLATRSV